MGGARFPHKIREKAYRCVVMTRVIRQLDTTRRRCAQETSLRRSNRQPSLFLSSTDESRTVTPEVFGSIVPFGSVLLQGRT